MHCNKNLTDDQLEATFTATDEEMRQIEQPIECLIKRTNHKRKSCTRFFSNESALKQHHREPRIKPEKYLLCGKTINPANSLEKHLRSCEKVPTHPAKWQLCQATLDGPISSENGTSTSKKLMVEERRVDGAPAEHVEHWKAPEKVESALKYTAVTFRKLYNTNNKRDVLQHEHFIERQTRANTKAVKWYLSLNMNLCKSKSSGVTTDLTVLWLFSQVYDIFSLFCYFLSLFSQVSNFFFTSMSLFIIFFSWFCRVFWLFSLACYFLSFFSQVCDFFSTSLSLFVSFSHKFVTFFTSLCLFVIYLFKFASFLL